MPYSIIRNPKLLLLMIKMKTHPVFFTASCKGLDGKVFIEVVDLTEFIQAPPEAKIWVQHQILGDNVRAGDCHQCEVTKGDLTDLKLGG